MNELVDFRGVRHGNRNRANGAAQEVVAMKNDVAMSLDGNGRVPPPR